MVITLDRIEIFLWVSAEILRKSIDSSEYKHCILGLLFLKHLSDEELVDIETCLNEIVQLKRRPSDLEAQFSKNFGGM